MNVRPIEINKRVKLRAWLRGRLSGMYRYDVGLWGFAIAGLWLISCAAAALIALGMPTGFGGAFDLVSSIALNTIAMALSSALIAVLISLAGLRIARFAVGSMIYLLLLAGVLFYFSDFNLITSVIFSILITGVGASIGVIAGMLVSGRIGKGAKVIAGLAATAFAMAVVIYAVSDFRTSLSNSADADIGGAGVSPLGMLSQDPSRPGKYAYRYFTYGSGQDRHRHEFGAEADQQSLPVDASAYINDWPWLRSKFWGFDETKLPLNGRVWLPDGPGPFPLVIMVHGNHLMEQFSDAGYGYLGELLASRGMAAISVDENFLNYSVWSGIPEEDMKPRAWLLLKHIQQIQHYSRQESSPFYNRIDFQRIALLGHSRGGQAAAMAADRDRWFQEDSSLQAADSYSIQAVIGLAPTATVVDGKQAELKDINFLTLHGAKDSDVVNFEGDRFYSRTSFPRNAEGFKASLYIADASHSHFNTEWEADHSYPARLFVRPEGRLDGDEQRQIAKLYVSAFLETVFQRSTEYEILFKDYRTATDLLPSTRYYSQFQSGDFIRITDFAGADRSSLSAAVSAEAAGMSEWGHIEAVNRERKGKGNTGVMLEWKQAGSYSVKVKPGVFRTTEESILVFSMADLGRDLKNSATLDQIHIDIEVADASGESVRLSLERFMDIQPLPVTDYSWLPGRNSLLFKDKYSESSEPVFHTYELPLRKFHEADNLFAPSEWTKFTLHFDGGPSKVMLDEIGISHRSTNSRTILSR